jgi:hypothetical protein
MGLSAWPTDAEGLAWPKQRLKASVDIRKEVLCLLGMPFVRRSFQGVKKSRIEVMHEDQSMEEVYEWVV